MTWASLQPALDEEPIIPVVWGSHSVRSITIVPRFSAPLVVPKVREPQLDKASASAWVFSLGFLLFVAWLLGKVGG